MDGPYLIIRADNAKGYSVDETLQAVKQLAIRLDCGIEIDVHGVLLHIFPSSSIDVARVQYNNRASLLEKEADEERRDKKSMSGDQVVREYLSWLPLHNELKEKIAQTFFTDPKVRPHLRAYTQLKGNIETRMQYLLGLLCNKHFWVDQKFDPFKDVDTTTLGNDT